MKLLLGENVKNLPRWEVQVYRDALLDMLVLTRGNRRIARELHATITYLGTN